MKNLIIRFKDNFVYLRLRIFSKCKICLDGELYPHYGLAPHSHNLQKTGSIFGSTEIHSKDKWPDNFVEDKDCEGCGVYFCTNPKCNYYNLKKHDIIFEG